MYNIYAIVILILFDIPRISVNDLHQIQVAAPSPSSRKSTLRCYHDIFSRLRRDDFVSFQLSTETTIIAAGVNLDEKLGTPFLGFASVQVIQRRCFVCEIGLRTIIPTPTVPIIHRKYERNL